MKWVDGLKVWRRERNITAPQGVFVPSIQEELKEYKDAIEGFYLDKDGKVVIFQSKEEQEHHIIDALCDIIVISSNEVELKGYSVDLSMKQVVKEISSRRQDPIQQEEWSHYTENIPTGKWLKDKAQDPSTLYTADFSSCKLPIS